MNVTDRLHDIGVWLQGEQDVRTNQIGTVNGLIDNLIKTISIEQDTRADMQHEINVLKRQIAELRLVVFQNGTLVSMPRIEAAMKTLNDAKVAM